MNNTPTPADEVVNTYEFINQCVDPTRWMSPTGLEEINPPMKATVQKIYLKKGEYSFEYGDILHDNLQDAVSFASEQYKKRSAWPDCLICVLCVEARCTELADHNSAVFLTRPTEAADEVVDVDELIELNVQVAKELTSVDQMQGVRALAITNNDTLTAQKNEIIAANTLIEMVSKETCFFYTGESNCFTFPDEDLCVICEVKEYVRKREANES